MTVIRRNPVTRATAWFLTLAMTLPMLLVGGVNASAQAQQRIKVVVADFIDKATGKVDDISRNAASAVYDELTNTGQTRFDPISRAEMLKTAASIRLDVPSSPDAPTYYSQQELVQIAKAAGAEAILTGEVIGNTSKRKGGNPSVGISVNLTDVASLEQINGGISIAEAKPLPGQALSPEELSINAASKAAVDVVRQMVSRQLVSATVLNTVSELVVLNRGLRDGIKNGDEMVVLREDANGVRTKQARIKVARAYPTDSEAEIVELGGGIRPEDIARVVYRAPYVLAVGGPIPTTANRSVNFSAIGRTLSVIGLGVLVAAAGRGGQTSVTNVTAEASSENDTPIVRISFANNIFGDANVLQYKIFRNPDFPFSPTLGSTGNNGGGNNGGGANTTTGGLPIGTTTSTLRSYTDRPSPYFPYANGASVYTGGTASSSTGGGGNNNGGGNNGGGGGNSGCTVITPAVTTNTGFTPGRTYTYLITAVILRQSVVSGGSTGGNTGGGNNGGGNNGGGNNGGGNNGGGNNGGGNNGGGNNSGGTQCIESDPVPSGIATPISPVILSTPTDNQTLNITQFSPTFVSRAGADIFQLEISTDRSFTNPNLIFRRQILSTSPNGETPQNLPAAVDLTTVQELLNDATFLNYVKNGGNSPILYFRIGARHDEDQPGPVHWISKSSSDSDRTFRFVYSRINRFTGAPLPPPNPGRAASLLNRQRTAARSRNAPLPLPGETANGAAITQNRMPSIQDILTGRGRRRP